jgi:hypothetical protein
MALAGLLAAGVLGLVVIKAANQILVELGIAFGSFGTMVGAFIPMLWNLLVVIFLIVSLIAAIAGGGYFIFRYYKMLNALIAAKEDVAVLTCNLREEMNRHDQHIDNRLSERFRAFSYKILELEDKLNKALRKDEPPAPGSITNEALPEVATPQDEFVEEDQEPKDKEDPEILESNSY